MATVPFLGEIRMFGGNFAPRNWALCNGQLLSIAQNTALFSLLGTFYGGNGVSTFALPDLRGRLPMHFGTSSASGTTYVIGEQDGVETVAISVQELPAHTHQAKVSALGNTDTPVGHYPASDPAGNVAQFKSGAANAQMNAAAISQAGNSQPHNNIQPVTCVSYIIALQGIFPSRN